MSNSGSARSCDFEGCVFGMYFPMTLVLHEKKYAAKVRDSDLQVYRSVADGIPLCYLVHTNLSARISQCRERNDFVFLAAYDGKKAYLLVPAGDGMLTPVR